MSLHAANTVGLFCLLRLINYSRLGSQAASRQHLKVVNSFPPFALCASRFLDSAPHSLSLHFILLEAVDLPILEAPILD